MPMIETTTIRLAPAAAPARCRFRAEAVKNAVADSWSGEGPVAVSMMVSAPASASSRPSPLTTSTPTERAIGITSCPRRVRISTRGDPTRPVAPVTAIFWLLPSLCIALPFLAPTALSVVQHEDERDPLRSTGAASRGRDGTSPSVIPVGEHALLRPAIAHDVAQAERHQLLQRRALGPRHMRLADVGVGVEDVVVGGSDVEVAADDRRLRTREARRPRD